MCFVPRPILRRGMLAITILTLFFLFIHRIVNNENYIHPHKRLACIMDPKILNRKTCLSFGCIWDDSIYDADLGIPICYFPLNTGYLVDDVQGESIILKKDEKSLKCPYVKEDGDEFTMLKFSVKEIGAGIHVSIEPVDKRRYRPPIPINSNPKIDSSDKLTLTVTKTPVFSFSISRTSNKTRIFDTSIGGLFFADQFLQIASYLPSENVYGFGENVHLNLKHDLSKYKTWAMFSRDDKTDWGYDNTNGKFSYKTYNDGGNDTDLKETMRNFYGVHPFYICLEPDGKAHGVFIFNSNAQEATLGPAPHLVYRTIGGQLDLFYFPGPTPEEVIQQYQQVIGKPMLPPYWALGFHLSKWGYTNAEEVLTKAKKILRAEIPIDVMTLDIDYMDKFKDFTYDKKNWSGLPDLVEWLHKKNMKIEIVLDPGIEPTTEGWKRAQIMNANFIEWANERNVPQDLQKLYPLAKDTKVMLYASWPDFHVAAPDFFDPTGKTTKWWANELERFHTSVPFDSIWLDLNEPSSFATNIKIPWYWSVLKSHSKITTLQCQLSSSKYEIPPYRTVSLFWWENEGRPGDSPLTNYLSSKTLCMEGRTGMGRHRIYDTHNIFGLFEAMASKEAITKATGKRGLVIARSTFPTSGRYAGHWLGDNSAEWKDLRHHIIGIMEFNMFGIPFVGADVCGFNEPAIEELCLRWMQMGAFSPFFRNHNNGNFEKDPTRWDSVALASRKANLFRYRHLPYLYSLHFSAALKGGTVIRPLFFEFSDDSKTWTINYEFLWGSKMLIIPVVYPGAITVTGYLPTKSKWYSMYDHNYGGLVESGNSTFPAPLDSLIPVFVRAGSIIPRQRPSMTTTDSRKNEFHLLIAPDYDDTRENLIANGELFWDDGDSIITDINQHNYYYFEFEFFSNKDEAYLKITQSRKADNLSLPSVDNIEVFGYELMPNADTMKINNNEINKKMELDRENLVLNITSPNLIDLNRGGPVWMLTWNNLS